MKKIAIFDLDGTLLNTLEDLTFSTNYALKYFGYPLKSVNQVKTYVGNGVEKLIERAIPGGISNNNFNECLEIFKSFYKNNMYNSTLPYDGIVDLLKNLKLSGLKLGIVSNKFDLAVKSLSEKYFENLVDIAIGEDEKNGIKKKPAPDSILKIVNFYNEKKENCVYIGDSEVDIESAKNAGLDCISVSWGFKTREFLHRHGAKIIVDKPYELQNIILPSEKFS